MRLGWAGLSWREPGWAGGTQAGRVLEMQCRNKSLQALVHSWQLKAHALSAWINLLLLCRVDLTPIPHSGWFLFRDLNLFF